jgi:hypothetical protein
MERHVELLRLHRREPPKWHPFIGMTDDLARRIWMHREGVLPGFTKQYGVKNPGLVRTTRKPGIGLHPRAAIEEMESRVEDRIDPADESGLA